MQRCTRCIGGGLWQQRGWIRVKSMFIRTKFVRSSYEFRTISYTFVQIHARDHHTRMPAFATWFWAPFGRGGSVWGGIFAGGCGIKLGHEFYPFTYLIPPGAHILAPFCHCKVAPMPIYGNLFASAKCPHAHIWGLVGQFKVSPCPLMGAFLLVQSVMKKNSPVKASSREFECSIQTTA